jgi:hypothetical protein
MARLLGVCTAGLVLASCGQEPIVPAAKPAAPSNEEAGFYIPPRVMEAKRSASGATVLAGRTSPGASIRLATPQGRAFSALADESGAWRIQLPSLGEPTLFGLSSQIEGRAVQAEGYVAILPAPGPAAVLLRAGAGSQPLGPPSGALRIQAVDIDATGAAVVSGRTSPRIGLSVSVDGAAAREGEAAESGQFDLAVSTPLSMGRHMVVVSGGGGQAEVSLDVTPPRPPVSGPFGAERLDGAWRIDWMTPGGGLQTSIIFDRNGGA